MQSGDAIMIWVKLPLILISHFPCTLDALLLLPLRTVKLPQDNDLKKKVPWNVVSSWQEEFHQMQCNTMNTKKFMFFDDDVSTFSSTLTTSFAIVVKKFQLLVLKVFSHNLLQA